MVKIEAIAEADYQLILVNGEIDASSSIELDNALKVAAQNFKKILVDLKGLDYISSAGLGVFISYLDDLKKNHIGLVIYGLQPNVREVFEILGLQKLIKITETKESALERLNEA